MGVFGTRVNSLLHYATLIPMLLLALFIAVQGVNVPFGDEYAVTAPVAVATAEGLLQPSYFFQQESNHRLVFTKLTVALNTLLTGWDLRVEMWVNFVLLVASFVLLHNAWKRVHPPTAAWLVLPFALLLFALRQRPTFALYLGFYWGQLFMFAALWVLAALKVSRQTLLLLMFCVIGATFSNAGGLPLWIALVPALWLRGYRDWRYFAAWLAATVIFIGIFFLNYDFTVSFSGVEKPEVPLPIYLLYVLAFLGAPFALELNGLYFASILCFGIGLGVLLFNTHFLLRKQVPLSFFALPSVLILMAVGNAVIAAAARADIMYYVFDSQPLAARYAVAANWFWLAVLMISALALWHAPKTRRHSAQKLNRAVFISLLPVFIIVNAASWQVGSEYYPVTLTEQDRLCMLNYLNAPDAPCLNRFYESVWRHVDMQYLAHHRLTGFRDWYAGLQPAAQPVDAPIQHLNGVAGVQPTFVKHRVGDSEVDAFALPAPITVEQYVQLPAAPYIFFEAELYAEPLRTATFRFAVRDGRTISPLHEGSLEGGVALPIRVDLSAWRGKTILLVYETRSSEGAVQVLWIQPRLTASD